VQCEAAIMPVINPFLRRVCYRCYAPIRLQDCDIVDDQASEFDELGQITIAQPIRPKVDAYRRSKWREYIASASSNGSSPPAAIAQQILEFFQTTWKRLLRTFYIPPLNSFNPKIPTWRCPYCGYLLPYNISHVPSTIIGVIGARSSGKTHLIARMVMSLPELPNLAEEINSVNISNEKTQLIIHNRYGGYITSNGMLPTTKLHTSDEDPEFDPIVYQIVNSDNTETNLVVGDYSGEAFAVTGNMQRMAAYIRNIDGFVILIDPVTIPKLRDELPLWIRGESRQIGDINAVIGNLTGLLENENNILCRLAKFLGLPITTFKPAMFVISKADILHYISNARQANGVYIQFKNDQLTIDDRDATIRQWLSQHLQLQGFINQSKQYQPSRYALTSATGITALNGEFGNGLSDNTLNKRTNELLYWLYQQHRKYSLLDRFARALQLVNQPDYYKNSNIIRRNVFLMLTMISLVVISMIGLLIYSMFIR
jgi:hypothetical protein